MPLSYLSRHVHIGAGKLGIGLVVPIINSSFQRVMIIQRPTAHWQKYINGTTVRIRNSNGEESQYSIFKTDKIRTSELDMLCEQSRAIVLTDDLESIDKIVQLASSISTSIGGGMTQYSEILSRQPHGDGDYINVYPFENDDEMVRRFSRTLESSGSRFKIANTIADRICSKQEFLDDQIFVECEQHGEAIILRINDNVRSQFSTNRYVTIAEDEAAFNYFKYRKLWLLNGIHTIMAIIACANLAESKIPLQDWQYYHINVLNRIEGVQSMVEVFLHAQAMRLLLSTDASTINGIFKNDQLSYAYQRLVDYGKAVLNRVQQQPDLIKRVLNFSDVESIKAKVKTRINELTAFLASRQNQIKAYNFCAISIEEMLKETINLHAKLNCFLMEVLLWIEKSKTNPNVALPASSSSVISSTDMPDNYDSDSIPDHKLLLGMPTSPFGLICIRKTIYLVPESISIQYAILCEGRQTINGISAYTSITPTKVEEIVSQSDYYHLSKNKVRLIRRPPPKLLILDWRNTLVEEDALDDALCLSIPHNRTERDVYFSYLKKLQENEDKKWYDYLAHCYDFGRTYLEFRDMHYQHARQIHLVPYVEELLRRLKKAGTVLALVTNCSAASLELRLSMIGIKKELFNVILPVDDSSELSIKSGRIRFVLDKYKHLDSSAIMISDSYERDCLLAVSMGISAIWFCNRPQDEFSKGEPNKPWGTPDIILPKTLANPLTDYMNLTERLSIITNLGQLSTIWRILK